MLYHIIKGGCYADIKTRDIQSDKRKNEFAIK